jgi:hypothetical protein
MELTMNTNSVELVDPYFATVQSLDIGDVFVTGFHLTVNSDSPYQTEEMKVRTHPRESVGASNCRLLEHGDFSFEPEDRVVLVIGKDPSFKAYQEASRVQNRSPRT